MPEPICSRCGHQLDALRDPLRRLRWTRYWLKGFKSLFTGPMAVCGQCGAIFDQQGALVADGALATEVERRIELYRKDMAYLRDAFGGVIVAAELVVIWMIAGSEPVEIAQVLGAAAVGIGAAAPFTFFWRRARLARKELKRLSRARRDGHVLPDPLEKKH
ncbi:MAG TPA: hypothetical protein VGA22_09280 [Gemmatimonadales bacterium]|jgi:hypothetical protein